ncbi:rhodanese-like domain-containing protein [Paucibacter sp. B51]|uniref:rhodanese-like domain-containing protein n=1 Tax=Paucibacter sp. B51 TaxID=2993315 RepID=UPI0022EBB4C3|nr:rhodanese-like domain-containing protein [Paucibacter sp. B51]
MLRSIPAEAAGFNIARLTRHHKEANAMTQAFDLNIHALDAHHSLRAEAGTWLLDVREAHEVARVAYDVERFIHMPLSELQQRHGELPRNGKLIVACAAGGRSQQAMQFLLHRGHTQVCNLAGGMSAWMALGLPVRTAL